MSAGWLMLEAALDMRVTSGGVICLALHLLDGREKSAVSQAAQRHNSLFWAWQGPNILSPSLIEDK